MAERIIKYYSYENEVIYDCFAGSGTVGRVAQKLQRHAILSEMQIDYCEKMIKENNWQAQTGELAAEIFTAEGNRRNAKKGTDK